MEYCFLLCLLRGTRSFMSIGCSLQTFVKHHGSSYMVLRTHFVQKRGPFCSEAWSVSSLNVVCFVLRCGPFCPKTWSVSSGPFCPWSVLFEYMMIRLNSLRIIKFIWVPRLWKFFHAHHYKTIMKFSISEAQIGLECYFRAHKWWNANNCLLFFLLINNYCVLTWAGNMSCSAELSMKFFS